MHRLQAGRPIVDLSWILEGKQRSSDEILKSSSGSQKLRISESAPSTGIREKKRKKSIQLRLVRVEFHLILYLFQSHALG